MHIPKRSTQTKQIKSGTVYSLVDLWKAKARTETMEAEFTKQTAREEKPAKLTRDEKIRRKIRRFRTIRKDMMIFASKGLPYENVYMKEEAKKLSAELKEIRKRLPDVYEAIFSEPIL